ncbi:MAG: hypothetical protein WD733_21420 [Bryobacterales bacterium]
MKREYDFSKGERGKFYRPDAELNIPVYLESDVAKVVHERAREKNVTAGMVVNDWLRKDIRSRERTRKQKLR